MTTAEERREEAVDSLNKAIESLSDVVIRRCDGWDEFNGEYLSAMREELATLIRARDRLDPEGRFSSTGRKRT